MDKKQPGSLGPKVGVHYSLHIHANGLEEGQEPIGRRRHVCPLNGLLRSAGSVSVCAVRATCGVIGAVGVCECLLCNCQLFCIV